jgi:hypothetical protein
MKAVVRQEDKLISKEGIDLVIWSVLAGAGLRDLTVAS